MKKVIIERFTKADADGNYYMIVCHNILIEGTDIEVSKSSIIKLANKANPHDKKFPLAVGQEIELPKNMVS